MAASPWVAIARLALYAFGVALVTSRVGLIAHELLGHGALATGFGAEVDTWRLYWFAGGWIGYQRDGPWTGTGALTVQLGGIAVELLLAGALALAARRCQGPLAVGLAGAALGLALHGGLYLVTGTLDGFGDGTLLHRALGDDRLGPCLAITLALAVLAFLGARRLARVVRGWLPLAGTAQVVGLAVALGAAGGAHAGLAAIELRVRPSPTYAAIMTTERERTIERDLERWARSEAARGRAPDHRGVNVERRRLERARPARSLAPLALIAVAAAAILGTLLGRPRAGTWQTVELSWRAVRWAVTSAAVAALTVGVIDALAPK